MQHHCRFHFGRRVSKRFTYASSIFAAILALGMSVSAYAFVRLANGGNGLHWQQQPIFFTISTARTSPQITDGSSDPAIRMGFRQWESLQQATIQFTEDLNPHDRARTDWQSTDVHLVWFDTDGSSGMFTPGSGLVAVTPVSFDSFGNILDADMIFNNRDHQFSTTSVPGTFDVQNIATHEAGHFIGLDHSAVIGATMNPFAVQQDTRLRTLEKDDIAGAATVYPNGNFGFGSISGKVVDSANKSVSGAHVVAEATDGSGTPMSAGLSQGDGSFQVTGLPAGNYNVYVEPMDGAVQGGNLSLATSHLTIDTNFGTTVVGGDPANPTPVAVQAATNTPLGTISLKAQTTPEMILTNINPASAMPGDTVTLEGSGSGFVAGDVPYFTGFTVNQDKPFTIVSTNVDPFGQSFSITVKLDAAIPIGLRSIGIRRPSTKDTRILTGGFEIRAAVPSLSGIAPTTGLTGTTVTLSGTNLQAGGVAILGNGMVVNPIASGTTVSFAIPSVAAGTYDLTYQNPDGQFATITQAFTVTGAAAGSGSGGSDGGTGSSTTSSSGTGTSTTSGGSAPTQVATSNNTGGSTSSGGTSATGNSGFVQGSGSSGGGGGGGGCVVARGASGSPVSFLPFVALGLLLVLRRRRAA